MSKGVLAILGSGENAPGMTKVHRELLAPYDPVRAVNLNTAYGFQENVPQMNQKLEEYFSISLNVEMKTLDLTNYETASLIQRTIFKQEVREANYVFAGPGSPSWALAQWSKLDVTSDFLHVLDRGGTLCISSAAALTLGAFTAPVYEIYKVGVAPYWLDGLNILEHFGLKCVVIPHFDNAEGSNYDTSCCYLGKRRLSLLESLLPSDVATLGIDEHTALILDFAKGTASVQGRGNAYWRAGEQSRTLQNGSLTDLSELQQKVLMREPETQTADLALSTPERLAELVASNGSEATESLAKLVRLAQSGAEGFIDPSGLITELLAVRASARTAGNYDVADAIRNAIVDAGVEVFDSPQGSTWELKTP